MVKGPLRALLKEKDFYQRVERGILKFQVMHCIAVLGQTTQANGKKTDVGRQGCVRFSRGRRHPGVGVWQLGCHSCIRLVETSPMCPGWVHGLHLKP